MKFIQNYHKNIVWDRPKQSMWQLIPQKLMPPTRICRYCCKELKEVNGKCRVVSTGVRWAESANRKNNQGIVTFPSTTKDLKSRMEELGADYSTTKKGGLILNNDNGQNRKVVEQCYQKHKTLVNPIIDWTNEDIWEFIKVESIPYCSLYDEGFERLGCIGCPMGGSCHQKKEFERWPRYKELYIRAFDKMLAERKRKELKTQWNSGEEVMDWWLSDKHGSELKNQITMEELQEVD